MAFGFLTHISCDCQTPVIPQPDVKRVVTLVHGTFAKHADWIQGDQILPSTLAANCSNTSLDRFCWSGKNRHTSRLKAGDELRRHLVELISAFKSVGATAEHHVIAHSHGGNVALYALRERGDDDDALLADVKLITLATPFLFMRERPLSRWLYLVLPFFLLSTSMVFVDPEQDLLFILFFIWCFVGVLVFPLSLLYYWFGRSSPPFKLIDLVTGEATYKEAKIITVPAISSDRLCIIRGLGDEASGSLAAAQLANWIMTRLLSAFSNWLPFLFWTVIAGVILTFIVSFLAELLMGGVNLDTAFESVWVGGIAILLVGPLVALPLIAGFVALSNFPFGIDTLFWNYHAQTTAEASPLGASRVLVVGARQFRYDKLSHGVYEDSEAINDIVAQIEAWSSSGA